MIFQLTKNPFLFPDPHYGEDDGLIAVGGDLSPERLATAYSIGAFPWYGFKERKEILWWCPLQRFVIFPEEIHISHTMRQMIRRQEYHVTFNKAFRDVITHCSISNNRNKETGAWLGKEMIEAYSRMHNMGLCSSVEVWNKDSELVGGLYGINIGNNFFGESMFSTVANASKLALITLAQRLQGTGGIIDCQFETPHLRSMGGRYIPYEEYIEIINGEE